MLQFINSNFGFIVYYTCYGPSILLNLEHIIMVMENNFDYTVIQSQIVICMNLDTIVEHGSWFVVRLIAFNNDSLF